jgi:hypothetical protein
MFDFVKFPDDKMIVFGWQACRIAAHIKQFAPYLCVTSKRKKTADIFVCLAVETAPQRPINK